MFPQMLQWGVVILNLLLYHNMSEIVQVSAKITMKVNMKYCAIYRNVSLSDLNLSFKGTVLFKG